MRPLVRLVAAALVGACASTAASPDAATDTAPPDVPCAEATPIHSLHPGPLYVVAGQRAAVQLRLARDRDECAATYAFTTDDAAVLPAPAPATVARRRGSADLAVTAGAPGRTRLRVRQTAPAAAGAAPEAAIDVVVLSPDIPRCPMDTPAAAGALSPGGRVAGAAGSPLEAASVALPASVTLPAPLAVTLGCAPDQAPDGYDAIGPAVAFGPGATRLPREVPLTVPINPGRVPAMYELHVELAYAGPGVARRIVPVANARFTPDGRALSFEATRLGTWQAVLRRETGARRVRRRFTYRALLGISMGAVGASMIGTRHPERFDAIAPLGGPADSGFSGDYLRRWVFGGFCTAAERARLGDAACARATNERTPPPHDLGVAVQNFEVFFSPPGMGTGGTFDRRARFQGFRDIARMFGNPVMPTDPANRVLPLGVPASELTRPDAARCAQPVVLGGRAGAPRFYDDEYNPDGTFPVVTFCDGNHTRASPGEWAGGQGSYPVEITLAVDLDRDGVRDHGEPVIRNFSEPYRDVGVDNLASPDEPGYDPVASPDPAGDDYDRQYNPAGTEGNFLRDEGERYEDLGLDGVRCPPGEACPYDVGEGNGRFDTPGGATQGRALNPRALYPALPDAQARRLAVWVDGGVRDALQFGVNANHFVGALPQRGDSLHIYNSFSALVTGRPVPPGTDEGYGTEHVDFAHLPPRVMLRYGFLDATPAQVAEGDGAHVGTPAQLANRLLTAVWWLQSRWPGGDRARTLVRTQFDNAGRCANGYGCTFEFRSERAGRAGPLSVYLPPGYHDPENAGRRYPVVFFLHGYGMEPQDLVGAGYLVGNAMVSPRLAEWQRPAKVIMVFPDGRCREGDGCLEGTFYVDSAAGNARMETYFLDVYDFVTRTYRVREPEEVEVIE